MHDLMTYDVEATMKYVVRGEKATFHPGERDKSYWPGDEHTVTIHDIRPEIDELALERNGFVVVDEPVDVTDFTDADELARYCRLTEGLVQRLTGADKVVSFGPMIRTNQAGAHGHNQPAYGAHVDYGLRTVSDFTRDMLPAEEAERRLQGRYMLINVWRPIVMVESAPLAVCDARTVQARGPVRQRGRRRARRFQAPLAMGLQPRLRARPPLVLGAAHAAVGGAGVQAVRQRSRRGPVHRALGVRGSQHPARRRAAAEHRAADDRLSIKPLW